MSDELGRWLRQQRQARGWNVPELARRLRQAARESGDTLPGSECLWTMIRRWERGSGVSERYRLHYCRTFQLGPEQFGQVGAPSGPRGNTEGHGFARPGAGAPPAPAAQNTFFGDNENVQPTAGKQPAHARPAPVAAAQVAVVLLRAAEPGLADGRELAGLPVSGDLAYGWRKGPGTGSPWIEREVLMAAHESGEHAERAERRDIGEATLEQLRADVVRLSHGYMTGEPYPLFVEMRQVRNRIHAVLDRRLWPKDQVDLYFLLGCLNGLMSVAARDLGSPQAAEELVRAGWAYAVAIDHRPLMGRLRSELAAVAYWNNQPRRSRDMAIGGLEYLRSGPNGVLLQLAYARASAHLGDSSTARLAVNAANDARELDHTDDVVAIGGEFGFSRASQHYYAGSVVVELPSGEADAITELERAIELYAAGPEPDEDHSEHCKMLARIDLATARLRAGQLDAAATSALPVLSQPPNMRIAGLAKRFDRVRAELASPRYQGSPEATDLDERIEEFCRETILADSSALPGTPT